MEIWLDTIDFKTIKCGASFGWLQGITTNPGILSSAVGVRDTLLQLLEIQSKTVAVQVTATTSAEMIKEGRRLFSFSHRLLIKIPVNQEGLQAMHFLSQEGIPTLGTAIFTVRQALLAALSGAAYVAPYFSHIARENIDAFAAVKSMQELFQAHKVKTKIMGAALKQLDDVMKLAQMGIDAVTLPAELFMLFIDDDRASERATHQLHEKWHHAFGNLLLSDLVNRYQDPNK